MRSYNPNWPLSPYNRALLSVMAALCVGAATAPPLQDGGIPFSERSPTSVTNKRAKHAIHIPKLISKHRLKLPIRKHPSPATFPAELVGPGEFVNVDLKGAVETVKKQYKENNCDPNAAMFLPNVPIYIESATAARQPEEINFSYIPGQDEFVGSETLDLPKGTKAVDTAFYAFFEGKRYELPATIKSPIPETKPLYLDEIHLTIPAKITPPAKPNC